MEQLPLPGHTPGHTGLRIGKGPRPLLLWGDIVHDAVLQFAEPECGYVADVDGVRAALQRRELLQAAADGDWHVAGMHLPAPGFRRVRTGASGFAFVPDSQSRGR